MADTVDWINQTEHHAVSITLHHPNPLTQNVTYEFLTLVPYAAPHSCHKELIWL